MTDPPRLSDSPAGSLFRSLRDLPPPADLPARTLASLGLPPAPPASPPAPPAAPAPPVLAPPGASLLTGASLLKPLAAGLTVLALGGGAVHLAVSPRLAAVHLAAPARPAASLADPSRPAPASVAAPPASAGDPARIAASAGDPAAPPASADAPATPALAAGAVEPPVAPASESARPSVHSLPTDAPPPSGPASGQPAVASRRALAAIDRPRASAPPPDPERPDAPSPAAAPPAAPPPTAAPAPASSALLAVVAASPPASLTLPAAAGPASSTPTAARPRMDLDRELASLDLARSALAAGSPARALEALAAYRAAFPAGQLGAEALLLEIEARVRSGDRATALAQAQAFLARHPRSVLAPRVRSLVGLPPAAGTNP